MPLYLVFRAQIIFLANTKSKMLHSCSKSTVSNYRIPKITDYCSWDVARKVILSNFAGCFVCSEKVDQLKTNFIIINTIHNKYANKSLSVIMVGSLKYKTQILLKMILCRKRLCFKL